MPRPLFEGGVFAGQHQMNLSVRSSPSHTRNGGCQPGVEDPGGWGDDVEGYLMKAWNGGQGSGPGSVVSNNPSPYTASAVVGPGLSPS